MFWDIIAIISEILNNNGNNLELLIVILVIILMNNISMKAVFKKYNDLENSCFSIIKECSRLLKQQDFLELYDYLKKIRKSSWYYNKRADEGNMYRLYNYYQHDEYEIDYLEKK